MADDRKPYTVTIGGVEHEMLLSPEDAKRLEATAVSSKQATASDKSRTTKNKSA